MNGHRVNMGPASALGVTGPEQATEVPFGQASIPALAEIYETHFDYVWRVARRLGVHPANLDDVVQDVFVAVHRRLPDFEARSSLKTWLHGIAIRVVRDYRRRARRKPQHPLDHELADAGQAAPDELASRSEAQQLLHEILDSLSDDKREVFVLTELEQLSAPEISALLSVNVNTVYARLRAARQQFDQAVTRQRARDSRRSA